ncbi:hypothetical protein BS78_02G040100 [Paspalum vaginatum]|nr:hypothetical protein BS78_02G040100 [Paspalum vaginatum]
MELTAMVSVAVALAAILAVFVLSSIVSLRRPPPAMKLPPGPRGWPVFGSLDVLAGALPPHRALAALAARHGPLMHLRLGSYHTVVASSADTARLVLKTHDFAFADRPHTAAGEIISYNYLGIVHTPFGAYWRMARKLCATELFSARRVDSFERVRAQEMRALARGLFRCAGRAVAVREHVAGATLRNILRMAVGEKWSGCYGSPEGEAFRRTLDEAFAVTGAVSNVGEWVPWLGWLDLQGSKRRMKRIRELYDRFYERIIDEHEERRRRAGAGEFVPRDLVDVLLQLAEEDRRDSEARLPRDGVKAFIQDIIAGGTESSAGDDRVGHGGASSASGGHGGRHRRARPRRGPQTLGDGARPAGPPLHRRRREGDAAAAPRRPAPRPAPRTRAHGGRRLRRARGSPRAGERVGHRARPGVVARRARRVPAGAVPGGRLRRGRARGALPAAAVRRRAAYLPGVRPRDQAGGRRRGEPGARVRVAAAGRGGAGGRQHGGARRAVHAPEGSARRRRRAQAAGALLRRRRHRLIGFICVRFTSNKIWRTSFPLKTHAIASLVVLLQYMSIWFSNVE